MECYNKGPGEKLVIMDVREALPTRFEADNWTDLRIGWFLSITDDTNDDTITGLTEDIGADDTTQIAWTDRLLIGVTGGTGREDFVFCGFTNAGNLRPSGGGTSFGRSRLVSSDGGVGTSDTDYYRVTNGLNNKFTAKIVQNYVTRASTSLGSQAHFVQDYSGGHADGYASLWALRLTRPDTVGRARIITMQIKKPASGDSSDLIYSSTPTTALIEAQLEAWPTTVQTLGPVELSHVPDTLYIYSPFHNSRIRQHARGVLKIA